MARIDYAPGTRSEGIEHWKHVATSVEAQEKKGTHTYWFLADPENDDVLYSLERYRDEKYLWDVHVVSHLSARYDYVLSITHPSAAIQENMKNQKHIRTGLLLRLFESLE
jgi:quinol monooxygenase YgiN